MTRLFTILLAGTALLGSVAAHAATETFGGSVSSVPTDVTGSVINSYGLFDTTLGTLNSITFISSYGFTSTITVTAGPTGAQGNTYTESAMNFSSNNSAVTSVLNSRINTAQAAIGGGTTAFIGNSSITPIAYDVLGNRNSFTLAPGAQGSFTSATTNPNTGGQDLSRQYADDTSASDLAAFSASGGGTFNVDFTTLTGTTTTTSSGNDTNVETTLADAGFGIIYNYTPTPPATVPEPASMALLGAGLLGAGLVRRRSRK